MMATAWSFQIGALRFTNFAYGASIMLTMYITWFFVTAKGWSAPLVVIIVVAFNFLLGYMMRKTMLRRRQSSSRMIICTMGLQMIITNVAIILFSGYPRDMGIRERRIFLAENVSFGLIQAACFCMSLVLLLSFHFMLKKTWMGRSIRAVVQNEEVAMLMGIRSERVLDIAFSISYVLIGVSSMMIMTMYQVEPTFGGSIQAVAFIVCVLAGIGNLGGTFISGIIVGVVSALISYTIGTMYLNPILYTVFVLMLIVKPTGLFNKKSDVASTI